MSKKTPIRILQIVGGMPRHGSETWLMHVLRHIDRQQFQMDFLVHTLESYAYNDEIRALGSRVIACLHPLKPWLYANNFKQVLNEYGSYDIVHSHIHHYSGFVLRLAQQAGIPVRIVHSHNDTSRIQTKAGLLRQFYLSLMSVSISRYATAGLAASKQAALALFGSNWERDSRWQILHCGIDLAPFKTPVDSVSLRAELGIPPDAFVIGHIGRFFEQKNHTFVLDIFAEVRRREPKAYLLLVGNGPLRGAIEQKASQLSLNDHVIFAGLRSDIPRLMRGAMDIFIFPSLYEGLPLSLMEAQAAGLPCIFSDAIPEEADVTKPLLQRLSLSQTALEWADAVLAVYGKTLTINQSEALASVENSKFNIQNGIEQLTSFYMTMLN